MRTWAPLPWAPPSLGPKALPSPGLYPPLGSALTWAPRPCPPLGSTLPWAPPSPEPVLIQEVDDVTAVIDGVHVLAQQVLLPLPVLGGLQTLCRDS